MNPIDDSIWDELLEMVEEGIVDLIEAFISTAPVLINDMEVALNNTDDKALRHASHTLKSSAASMGAMKLSEYCKIIETQARSGDISHSRSYFESAKNELIQVENALNKKLE